jgi:hypothetical protein
MRLMSNAVGALTALIVATVLSCGLVTVASADTEPNNGIAEAEGPMSGGVPYSGSIADANDVDTYVFYVSGEVPLDVHVASTSNSCLRAALGNADNARLESAGVENQSADLTYTTAAGVNRFYLEFASCFEDSGPYSFSISPAAAIVGGPPTLAQNAIPGLHEYAAQAFGPLTANVAYTDALLTSNDQNWLTFFTPLGQETVDVEATMLGRGECFNERIAVDKETVYLQSDRWTHETFTSQGSAQHFIASENCQGLKWEMIVKAASLASGIQSAAVPPPFPPPSDACLRDRANLAKAELFVRRYRRKLDSHHLSRKARHEYRRRLNHVEALVKRYAALRHRQCPGGH